MRTSLYKYEEPVYHDDARFQNPTLPSYDFSVGEQYRRPPELLHPVRPVRPNFHQSSSDLNPLSTPYPHRRPPPIQRSFNPQYCGLPDQSSQSYRIPQQITAENGMESSGRNYVKFQKPHNNGVMFIEQDNLGGRLLPSEALPVHHQKRELMPYRPPPPVEISPQESQTRKVENHTPGLEDLTGRTRRTPRPKRKLQELDRLTWTKTVEELDTIHSSMKGWFKRKTWDWVPLSISD
eukprot:g839.t1